MNVNTQKVCHYSMKRAYYNYISNWQVDTWGKNPENFCSKIIKGIKSKQDFLLDLAKIDMLENFEIVSHRVEQITFLKLNDISL
jgi:hypothetical protein